jgi:hypothetical protein
MNTQNTLMIPQDSPKIHPGGVNLEKGGKGRKIKARARGASATPEALKRPRDPLYSSVTKHEERNGVQSRDRRRA